jgi:hypothetical protein
MATVLQVAGLEVDVHIMAADGRPGANCAFFKEHGIPVHWVPWQMHLPNAVRSFLDFLEESQPDVCVPNCDCPGLFRGRVCTALRNSDRRSAPFRRSLPPPNSIAKMTTKLVWGRNAASIATRGSEMLKTEFIRKTCLRSWLSKGRQIDTAIL